MFAPIFYETVNVAGRRASKTAIILSVLRDLRWPRTQHAKHTAGHMARMSEARLHRNLRYALSSFEQIHSRAFNTALQYEAVYGLDKRPT
ncbi:MAG: hypothetical protein JWQ42_218 [Edaphobacter sp.]|nr:hypothetical protein [Edaphobacter sp.]